MNYFCVDCRWSVCMCVCVCRHQSESYFWKPENCHLKEWHFLHSVCSIVGVRPRQINVIVFRFDVDIVFVVFDVLGQRCLVLYLLFVSTSNKIIIYGVVKRTVHKSKLVIERILTSRSDERMMNEIIMT